MNDNYYRGFSLLILNLAIALGTFIQVLDTSIANVAIPYIAGNLNKSVEEGTWVITSFAASNAIVLPLTGWLTQYFGSVRVFVASTSLFALVSFLCGCSINLPMLVFFRVIQGAVAGSLIPLSQSLINMHNPIKNRGFALGFWAVIVVTAPILGPLIGGYLTQKYSWPWIFYINVPIGIFSSAITWFFLKDRESEIHRLPIDWIGLWLLAIGVGSIQIMLDNGKNLDWFESNTIIVLTIISIISLTYFVLWSHFEKSPIVDLSIFFNRNFAFGTLALTIGYLIYFSSTVTIPLWLQTQQGYTALWAGIAIAPVGLPTICLSRFVRKLMRRYDLRFLATLSFIFFSIGFFYQSHFTTQVDIIHIILSRLLQGVGIVFFFLPIIELTMSEIPKEKYTSASGLMHFIRILVGTGFGTSLSVELWSHMEIHYHALLAETLTAYRQNTAKFYQLLENYMPTISQDAANAVLDRQVEIQAYMLSTNDISWLGATLFLMMIPLIYLCKRAVGGESISFE